VETRERDQDRERERERGRDRDREEKRERYGDRERERDRDYDQRHSRGMSMEDVQLGLVSGAVAWYMGFIFRLFFHYFVIFLSFFPKPPHH